MSNEPTDNKPHLVVVDEAVETISVPDVQDIIGPDREETPEEHERNQVIQVQAMLGEQNQALLGQLRLVGKQPTPLMLIKLEHDVLLDFVFGENGEAREAYTTACHMQLNSELKRALGQHFGIPEDASDVTEPSE